MWIPLLLLSASVAAQPETLPVGELAGTWELREAPPFDPSAAWPQGVENLRYVFEANGDWYSLQSDERRSGAKPIGTFERIAEDRVRFHTPEGKAPESQIKLTADTLEIMHGEHGSWLYQRVTAPAAIEGPIELKSLERLEVDATTASATSFHEYLARSTVKSDISDRRMDGVWELVRVRGVPEAERPEQGYYNDVLIVAPTHLCFVQRADQNGAACADAHQKGPAIELKDDAGKTASTLQVQFNDFGQLELAVGTFTQTYTLIHRDPAKAPAVPLKIAVYRD